MRTADPIENSFIKSISRYIILHQGQRTTHFTVKTNEATKKILLELYETQNNLRKERENKSQELQHQLPLFCLFVLLDHTTLPMNISSQTHLSSFSLAKNITG
ncbi:hypothetical protein PRUPE_2G010200 [Prunus persica]|uniref:Uncharacterized protein n=1 Tax=Prunus persica TaxID=3760 RepID=A0A251Q919_PRUPE|nr:hypothetical protein PRUPE_2G010200 [Prunus persica]